MKTSLFASVLCLMAVPSTAQELLPAPSAEVEEGFSLMEEGAKLLFKGLMSGMEPAMQDMGRALAEMEPALRDLMVMMGDIGSYHPPEMQANGDILIRRKTAVERLQKGPEIDL